MAITRQAAKELCTKSEFELVAASFSPEICGLDDRQLRSLLGRARRMRDKWRDTAERQVGEARGKRPPRKGKAAKGGDRTQRKLRLFAETLERVEKRVRAVEERQEREAARLAAAEAAAREEAAREAAARQAEREKVKSSQRESRKAASAAKPDVRLARVGKGQVGRAQSIRAHLRSANRRTQAKRDRR